MLQDVAALTAEQLSTELSGLPDDVMVAVIEQALTKRRVGTSHAPLSTMLRLALRADEEGPHLFGTPAHLHDAARDAFVDFGIRVQAQRAVLDVPLLTSRAVAEALRAGSRNTREVASRLRREGVLLGVLPPGARAYVYPAFQIDPAAGRLRPVVATVNTTLGAVDDPWGVASWWVSPDDSLDEGRAPMHLVGTDVEDDLLALVGALPPSAASDARAVAALAPA